MKKIKYVLYGLIALVIILLIAAIFLPKEYSLQLERKVDASNSIVYGLISDLNNRGQWDPIVRQSNVLLNESNDSENFGWLIQNEDLSIITLKSVEQNSIVRLERKVENGDTELIEYILDEAINSGSAININYTGRSSWPCNLYNFFTKRSKRKILDAELAQLELIAKDRENERIYNGYKIVEDIVKERNFILKRDQVSTAAMQQFYVQNLGVLFKSAQDAGMEMDGMPCGLFFTNDMKKSNTIDMAAAIPVMEEVNIPGAESKNIKTRTAIVVDYYGDYNKTMLAHNAIKAYMADNGYIADIPIIEEYVTDPGSEKDPNKWLTKITYYIEGK